MKLTDNTKIMLKIIGVAFSGLAVVVIFTLATTSRSKKQIGIDRINSTKQVLVIPFPDETVRFQFTLMSMDDTLSASAVFTRDMLKGLIKDIFVLFFPEELIQIRNELINKYPLDKYPVEVKK